MTKHIDRLTRYEADIVVRQLTGRYYDKYGFDNGPLFDDFAAKLAWQIGGENTWDYSSYLFDVLTELHSLGAVYGDNLSTELRDWHEGELNVAVDSALGAANIPGDMSRYYTQPLPTPTGLQPNPNGGLIDRARFDAMARATHGSIA